MPYFPDAGDLVWLTFYSQTGREQAGRRPALILSPVSYNRRSGLAIACPVTTRAKGYPFEVPLPLGLQVSGVVLADQVKSLDWHDRRAELIGRLPDGAIASVRDRLGPLLGF